MCYHKAQTLKVQDIASHYQVSYADTVAENYSPRYHENGFDYLATPVLTAGAPHELKLFNWGLIPFWSKSSEDALKIRTSTLNCISEEMYEKASFRDAAKNNQRCLIPCTGFYEWKHVNNGKEKIPHYIGIKNQKMFSLAGIYSRWMDKDTQQYTYTYSVLTTRANKVMAEIHNSKQRMPVIIPYEFEKDWLNINLTKDDVMAFCQPIDDSVMSAYTISKLISTKGVDTNVPDVMKEYKQEDLRLF